MSAAALPGKRLSWRLSPSGQVAVCTLVTEDGAVRLEVRHPDGRALIHVPHLSVSSQLLPSDDATVVMCHHRGGRHEIEAAGIDGSTLHMVVSTAQSAALVRTPAGVLLLEGDGRRTTVGRLAGNTLLPLGMVDGRVVGAVPFGPAGKNLAVNVVDPGVGGGTVELDLVTGGSTTLLAARNGGDNQVVHFVTGAGLVVISATVTGEQRLGYGRPENGPIRFPETLAAAGGTTFVAASADGARIAVAAELGAVSSIRLLDTDTGHVRTPPLPPLVVTGRGHLDDRNLIVPVSTPDRAGTLLRLDLASGAGRFDDVPAVGAVAIRHWDLPGAVGRIECLIVGDPVRAETVVVALHGGPLSAWRAEYDPLLVGLGGRDLAVVAPNIRGSTGYGREHALAIRDRWGGPDLEDVLGIAASLRRLRGGSLGLPVVLGHSYGGWLSLLAAAAQPTSWAACVAISPFVSGHNVAIRSGPVGELVNRLGGRHSPDARHAAARMIVPTLLLHGAQDTVVPASQTRLLAAALPEATASRLVILDGCGHNVFTSRARQTALDEIVRFCAFSTSAATHAVARRRPAHGSPGGGNQQTPPSLYETAGEHSTAVCAGHGRPRPVEA